MSGDAQRRIRAGWELNVSPDHATADGNFDRFAEVAAQYPTGLPMILAQVQANMAHDANARLSEIRAPTLVVHGTADQMLAAANGEQIAGLIPGARLELLDGVGHLFYWEQPERVAQLISAHAAAARA
jgi:pimeloyl-ACP methyl ester carboxylesterase